MLLDPLLFDRTLLVVKLVSLGAAGLVAGIFILQRAAIARIFGLVFCGIALANLI